MRPKQILPILNSFLKTVSLWQLGRGFVIRARQSELEGQCLASEIRNIVRRNDPMRVSKLIIKNNKCI